MNNTINVLNAKSSDRVLMLCLLLFLQEHSVTFEYLSGNKSMSSIADTLTHIDIDNLKIQEE
jgi:hypothetical protein